MAAGWPPRSLPSLLGTAPAPSVEPTPAETSAVQELAREVFAPMLDARIAELRVLVAGLISKKPPGADESAELTLTLGRQLRRWRIIGGMLGGFLAVATVTGVAAWQTFDAVRRETVDTATEAKTSAAVAGVQATTAKVDAMTVESRVDALERRSDRIESKLDRVLDALEAPAKKQPRR